MTPEVIPPRVPQYNWVDLGLPSGTLWLDRFVGADSPSSPGLFYQWGSLEGHTSSDGFVFDTQSYEASGLNLIDADLTPEQDAAQAFYGSEARMPSESQLSELLQYCSGSAAGSHSTKFTSSINGNSITLRLNGFINGTEVLLRDEIRAWTRSIVDVSYATSLHAFRVGNVGRNLRYQGLNVLAVHS